MVNRAGSRSACTKNSAETRASSVLTNSPVTSWTLTCPLLTACSNVGRSRSAILSPISSNSRAAFRCSRTSLILSLKQSITPPANSPATSPSNRPVEAAATPTHFFAKNFAPATPTEMSNGLSSGSIETSTTAMRATGNQPSGNSTRDTTPNPRQCPRLPVVWWLAGHAVATILCHISNHVDASELLRFGLLCAIVLPHGSRCFERDVPCRCDASRFCGSGYFAVC